MSRTITYDRILSRLVPLTGVQKADLLTDDTATLRGFINRALRYIWEYARWPDVCTIEARTPSSNVIAWEQSGETAIGSVFAIYDVDPHGTTAWDLLTYDIITSGVKLVGDSATDDAVYLWYRHQCPDYYGDDYAATSSYVTGNQVYYSTTGDYYKCIDDAAQNDLPTDTDHWERLTVPWGFADYGVYAAYADWLRQDGQAGKAQLADRTAQESLYRELDILEREEGYTTAALVQTHLSKFDNT